METEIIAPNIMNNIETSGENDTHTNKHPLTPNLIISTDAVRQVNWTQSEDFCWESAVWLL